MNELQWYFKVFKRKMFDYFIRIEQNLTRYVKEKIKPDENSSGLVFMKQY